MLPGMVSANVTDSVNKIFVGDIPINLTEDQIMELLKAFGELRAFSLIKDPSTGISKGFAFCEYLDVQLTDIVCEGLNGMELAGKNLIVNRATPENNALLGELGPSVILPNSIYSGGGAQSDPSCVLLMMNIVAFEDLSDNTEYKDILEDIENECRRYGDVEKVVLPRPSELSDFRSVGKAYVKYTQKDDCSKALRAFAGRKFDGRVVVTSFYSEEAFDKGSLV